MNNFFFFSFHTYTSSLFSSSRYTLHYTCRYHFDLFESVWFWWRKNKISLVCLLDRGGVVGARRVKKRNGVGNGDIRAGTISVCNGYSDARTRKDSSRDKADGSECRSSRTRR